MANTIKKIFYLISSGKIKITFFVCICIFSSCLDLIGIAAVAPFMLTLMESQDYLIENYNYIISLISFFSLNASDLLIVFGIIILVTFFLKFFLIIFSNYYMMKFAFKEQINLRSKSLKKFQEMSYLDFSKKNIDSFHHRIITLPQEFSSVLNVLLKIISEFIVSIFIITFLAFLNFKILSSLIFLSCMIFIFYFLFFKKKIKRFGEIVNINSVKLISFTRAFARGFREISIMSNQDFFNSNIINSSKNFSYNQLKIQLLQLVPRYLLELVLVLFIVTTTIYIYSSIEIENNVILPLLATYAVASVRIFPFLNQLISGSLLIKSKTDSINRLFATFQGYDLSNSNQKQKELNQDTIKFKKITLKNVMFKFDDSKETLIENINLEINKGDKVLIIGSSGSGKSTLINIICGLISPTKGQVLVNEDNQIILNNFIKEKGFLLSQDNFIINTDLNTNIALNNNKNVKYDIFQESVEVANLNKEVLERKFDLNPDNLNLENMLSGGEKQRIGIARSFYFNREILILDEPTSSLDNETKHKILTKMQKDHSNKTFIVVSHDLNIKQYFSKIYKLNKKILEKEK